MASPAFDLDPAADADLVRRIAEGDQDALGRLYDRFSAVMMAVARRMLRSERDAEDLVHDIFLEVWKKAGTYDAARGSVKAWMLVRTRSRALDRLKSPGYARVVALDESSEEPSVSTDATAGADGNIAKAALDELGDDSRRILELAYFDGLSLSEIAVKLQLPLGTVKSRLGRALQKLREAMDVKPSGVMPKGRSEP